MEKCSFITYFKKLPIALLISFVLLEMGLRIEGFVNRSLQEYRNIKSLKEKGEYRILCLGESITQGIRRHGEYPEQLEIILNSKNLKKKFSVINKAVGDTNTGVILARLEYYLEKYTPDIVITMMGISDDLYSVQVKDNFREKVGLNNANTLRIYKLFRLLKLHMKARIKEGWKEKELISKRKDREKLKRDKEERKEMLKKALEIDPKNENGYLRLGNYYREQGKYKESEEMFKKAIEINPKSEKGYLGLGYSYREQGKNKEAVEMLKKAFEINPEDDTVKHYLSISSQLKMKPSIESEFSYHLLDIRQSNYRKLRNILVNRNIKLICVQYPMRSIEPLKKIIGEYKDVYFVDNEKIFKERVAHEGYQAYFTDRLGTDFGHMTIKGKRLLAGNIADVIIKEVLE